MQYNRMRRLPYIIEQEWGKNTLELYRKFERTVLKISNYKNHRRFSLRCLSKDITPVIQKLKNNIGTYKSKCIIHNTERKLLNEEKVGNKSIRCPTHTHARSSTGPWAKFSSDTKKSAHYRIYNILGKCLPEAEHQYCRRVKIWGIQSTKTSPDPKPNLKREETKALKQLKANIKKAKALLDDTNTYKPITTDPTTKLKNRLINILKMMKGEGKIDENTYRKIYPTGASAPKFYGLPKIHKEDVPLRPIVSSIGSVIYEVAKELSRILKPLLVTPSTM